MSTIKRIMVMDSDPHVCSYLRDYLHHFGYKVDCATSSFEAIHFLGQLSYDGLLIDTLSDESDGHQILNWLHEHDRHEPVIMMSDWADYDLWLDLIDQGAIDLLAKPIQSSQLKQALQKAIYGELLLYATSVGGPRTQVA